MSWAMPDSASLAPSALSSGGCGASGSIVVVVVGAAVVDVVLVVVLEVDDVDGRGRGRGRRRRGRRCRRLRRRRRGSDHRAVVTAGRSEGGHHGEGDRPPRRHERANVSIISPTSGPERVEDRAGAAVGDVLGDLGHDLVRLARRRAPLDDLVGDEPAGRHDLVVGRRPRQHPTDLVEQLLRDAGRLHDVRLLAEVLGDHQAGAVQRGLAIAVDAAHDELRAVDVGEPPTALGGATLERGDRLRCCTPGRRGS